MCNSENLKPGGIIELILIIVNVMHIRPGLGVEHTNQPAQKGYGGVRSVGIFIAFGEVNKNVLCA